MVCEFRIGRELIEFLSLTVLRRSYSQCDDYWDGNWLTARINVAAGGFRGTVNANIRAEEIVDFHQQLAVLYSTLRGEAVFETIEAWLTMNVVGDGRGHLRFDCGIRDQPGVGNLLRCSIAIDQTQLAPALGQLANMINEYPVIGKP